MWAIVRFFVTGSMLGFAVLVEDGVGWVAGVPDRERARAAAEERVVTMAAQSRAVRGGVGERIDAKRGYSNNELWGLETLCTEIRLRLSVDMYQIKDGNEGLDLDGGAEMVMSGMGCEGGDGGDGGDSRVGMDGLL